MKDSLTVIMPVYQAQNTLCRAVDSVLGQSFSDFILMLVDDGSSDGSSAICDNYAKEDPRVEVIHQANKGASSARNAALDKLQTEWVTFCDADDYMDNNRLQAFMECTKTDVECVVAGITYVYEDSMDALSFGDFTTGAVISADMMSKRESFGYLHNKCFKTSIIQSHHLRFNPNFCFLEDEEFICHYWQNVEKVRFIDSVGYKYIVPDFNQKYGNIDGYQLYKNLLNSASTFIPLDSDSVTLRKYTMGCFRSMMYAYLHHNYTEAWHRLKELASYSKDYKRHNKYMNVITQWNYMLWHPILIVYTLLRK